MVGEERAGTDVSRPAGNFIVRHWRGELPLGIAFWVVNLVVLGIALLLSEAHAAVAAAFTSPGAALVETVLIWTALALVSVWQIVGLWRSASAHEHRQRAQNKSRFWAAAAKVMAVLGAVQAMGHVAETGAPQISELYEMAIQGDPTISDGKFTLLEGGTELSFGGGIKYGAAAELEQILNTAPGIRVLHLTSEGGRIQAAIKLFRLVAERGLETYVSRECVSACTLVFAAGQRRWLSDAARLGFHPATFAGLAVEDTRKSNEAWTALFEVAGVDAAFVDKVLAVPPREMWYPTVDELLEAKVVTDMDAGEHFQASGNETVPTLAEIESIARDNNRLIDALHELSPDLTREIYVQVRKEMVAGTLSPDTMGRIGMAVEKVIMAYMPLADDDVIVDYAALIASRYAWMLKLGAAACFEYTQTGYAPGRADELNTRELEIYERILRTAKERPVPDPMMVTLALANAIEGIPDDRWLVYLETSREIRPDEYEAFCRGGIAFFQAVAGLPREQAAAIMRDMYRH